MIPTRHHLHAIATCSLLAAGLSGLPTGTVLAEDQKAPVSSDDADSQVISLLTRIENALVEGNTPLDGGLTMMLVSATNLLPQASIMTQKLFDEFPNRLRRDADKERLSGDLLKGINLDVFATATSEFMRERAKTEIPKPPTSDVAARSAPAVPTPPAPGATSVPAPVVSSSTQERTLMERGDAMLRLGDVSAARMLYERVAASGLGIAALKLAETYDAGFLTEHNLRGVKPDPAAAEEWYRKAAALGETKAADRLKALEGHRLATTQ